MKQRERSQASVIEQETRCQHELQQTASIQVDLQKELSQAQQLLWAYDGKDASCYRSLHQAQVRALEAPLPFITKVSVPACLAATVERCLFAKLTYLHAQL